MENKHYTLLAVIVLITIFNLSLVYFVFTYSDLPSVQLPNINIPGITTDQTDVNLQKFESEDDFKTYLSESTIDRMAGFGFKTRSFAEPMTLDVGLESSQAIGLGMGGAADGAQVPERISETNVQVVGIDEPDILKTDGQEIYFSSQAFFREPFLEVRDEIDAIIPNIGKTIQPRRTGATKTIKAFPPADLKIDGEIDQQGELLLSDDILVVLSHNQINGYDVSDPADPDEKWSIEIENRNWLETARLFNGKIYLITRTIINQPRPCPIMPLTINGSELSIACNEIYHPTTNIPVDSTYTIMEIDPETGEVDKKTAFVGSYGSSVIYMSPNAIYLTYSYSGDVLNYILNFFKTNSDLVPNWVIDKLTKLDSYDISNNAKMAELSIIFEQFIVSIDEDEALKLENEFANRMEDYAKEHSRELEQTGIAKIDVNSLEVKATGSIPGSLLNQFSMDEYKDHLRIATTVGNRTYIPIIGSRSGESLNDVYVLDKNLKQTGAILDLGLTERIYSARFIEDKGYLVTFRQIDPFYVLDLSNPKKPAMKGELKIPGYSSYLHPITKDKILGIGKEDNQVKISLFDVADPSKPKEISKYTLDEYWSDILNTHHAFLMDAKFKVFFMPGGKGGYIFSYENNKIELIKAVSQIRARRALFLDDYLYMVGDDEIVVLNENDWQEVNNLNL
jgi:inhibitor of cysteine peptidase